PSPPWSPTAPSPGETPRSGPSRDLNYCAQDRNTDEFRRDAVGLVRSSGRPINEVARDLGVSHETLRGWVRKAEAAARPPAPGELSAAERDELRRLRKRVAGLETEKEMEILQGLGHRHQARQAVFEYIEI
ncbi:transposase, partial [Catellatospora sp. NPDC049609]|uniref:transposase n=1 Tax=Catellatospora sp. NPDC049609 TaxID=3155505 RepID=UPI003426F617